MQKRQRKAMQTELIKMWVGAGQWVLEKWGKSTKWFKMMEIGKF